MRIHINIGSNLGERERHIAEAIEALRQRVPGHYAVSAPYESEPWGFESVNRFVNVGVMIDRDEPIEPVEILDLLQLAEQAVGASPHRDATGAYIDRNVDIDLIAVDDVMCHTRRLELPHPRMEQRDFVLRPMAQLDPQWRHPATGLTVLEMIERLPG